MSMIDWTQFCAGMQWYDVRVDSVGEVTETPVYVDQQAHAMSYPQALRESEIKLSVEQARERWNQFCADMNAVVDQIKIKEQAGRRHVSEGAMRVYCSTYGTKAEHVEHDMARDALVLMTVAEHEELLRQSRDRREQDCVVSDLCAQVRTAESERDALRAEVERLRAYQADIAPRIDRAQKVLAGSGKHLGKHVIDGLCDEIERLRKGREDGQVSSGCGGSIGREIRVDADCACNEPRSDSRVAACLVTADNLDPRLGIQQPEGEPGQPMPYWRRRMGD